MSAFSRRGFGSSRIRYLGGRGRGRGRGHQGGQYASGHGPQRDDYHTQKNLDAVAGPSQRGSLFMSTSQAHSQSDRSSSIDRDRSKSPNRRGNIRGNSNMEGTTRGGRPPHLRGAAIGLWYRDNAINVKKNLFSAANNMRVSLSAERQENIATLLYQLGTPTTLSFDMTDARRASSSNAFQRQYLQNLEDNAAPRGESLFDSLHGPIPLESSRDPSLDDTLKEELQSKLRSNLRYQHMLNTRRSLPAYDFMNDILDLVVQNQVIVLSGETGSGKTTQVGQFILDRWITDGNGSVCNIVCTQPRRISAISVAQRVADERDETVGGKSIGYSIRLESKLPMRKGGTITFCTTGVVLKYLESDPYLNQVSHIIIDEIHERDVLCDFLLAVIKDLIPQRPDLKVILMSATLNAPHFQAYFNHCPLFQITGIIHPVTVYYLEDVLEQTNFMFPPKVQVRFKTGKTSYKGNRAAADSKLKFDELLGPYIRSMQRTKVYSQATINQIKREESEELNLDLIERVIQHICCTDEGDGSILVFLPGWDNISTLSNQLSSSGKYNSANFIIIPLHSMMPTVNQREVFNPPPPGKRKIILSTNIAETSITIEDIVYVIDCGRIKMTNFDLQNNIETLSAEWVSLSNAKQRRGRAGRVQAGVCYHLFSKGREALLDEFLKPEVLRKRLEEVILQIKVLRLGNSANFLNRLLDPPEPRSVELALKRLLQLNALDHQENLTPLGFHLAQLPMDPQTGRMILLGAMFSCCDPILSVAASLSFKDAFMIPMGQEQNVDRVKAEFANGSKSDHLVLIRALAGYEDAKVRNTQRDYCYRNFLSTSTLNMLVNLKGQFAQNLFDRKLLPSTNWRDPHMNVNSRNDAIVKAIICAGLYPNVGKVRVKKYPLVYTIEDGRVNIHPKSVNAKEMSFESPFVVYHQKMKSSSVFLYDTTMVSPFPLIFFGGQLSLVTEDGFDIIKVDETVRFNCRKNIYEMIQGLRGHLDNFLEDKIRNPGPTYWGRSSKQGDLLRAIVELITAENREIMNEDTGGSDSGSDVYERDWD